MGGDEENQKFRGILRPDLVSATHSGNFANRRLQAEEKPDSRDESADAQNPLKPEGSAASEQWQAAPDQQPDSRPSADRDSPEYSPWPVEQTRQPADVAVAEYSWPESVVPESAPSRSAGAELPQPTSARHRLLRPPGAQTDAAATRCSVSRQHSVSRQRAEAPRMHSWLHTLLELSASQLSASHRSAMKPAAVGAFRREVRPAAACNLRHGCHCNHSHSRKNHRGSSVRTQDCRTSQYCRHRDHSSRRLSRPVEPLQGQELSIAAAGTSAAGTSSGPAWPEASAGLVRHTDPSRGSGWGCRLERRALAFAATSWQVRAYHSRLLLRGRPAADAGATGVSGDTSCLGSDQAFPADCGGTHSRTSHR